MSSENYFTSELWSPALERYAKATHLTVQLFDSCASAVLGPIHPTPLFDLFDKRGLIPDIFTECVHRCLTKTDSRPAVIVSESYGLTAIGTSLALEGNIVGAAVAGYALVDFSQLAEVQRLAKNADIKFDRVWQVAREQKPVPRQRLILNGELLQVLGDALLKERYRTWQYKEAVVLLEEAGKAKDQAYLKLQQTAASLREREAELHKVNDNLQRVNEDLNQFAYAAAHDLREPLRNVSTFSELLVRTCHDDLDENANRFRRYILEGVRRMDMLLTDLLEYTHLERVEETSGVNANTVLEKVLENLGASISESAAVITHDNLPDLFGQESHYIQLFQNLISNSIKYRSGEPPCVHIGVRESGGEWLFSVRDNGVGIEREYRERIFGLFKRLHGNKIPGTGIGLAICRKIVQRYGGDIWVDSEPSKGSTFFFTFPKSARASPA